MLRIDAAIGSVGHPSGQAAGRDTKGFGDTLVRGSDAWLELAPVPWVSSVCVVGIKELDVDGPGIGEDRPPFAGTNMKLPSG